MAGLLPGGVPRSVGIPVAGSDATPDGSWVIADVGGGLRPCAAVDGWLWDEGALVQLPGPADAAW